VAATDLAGRGDRTTPLFGRSEIHDAVIQTLEQARRGSGQFLLLVGGGGVGKSMLLRRTVEDAQSLGYLAVAGRALPSDLPQPFALVQDLLRSLNQAHALERTGPRDDPTFLSLFLAPFETDRRSAGTGEVPTPGMGEADHLLDYLAGPPARVEESRILMFDRLTDFFLELTHREPLLLAVDDLHFADDSSIEFLEQFSRSLGASRVAVVATVVPREESPPHTAHLMERLLTGEHATRLTVRSMTEPEAADYARWMLKGRDPGRETVMRWFTQTEGNPLFLEYLVRASMGLASGPAALASAGIQDLETILQARVRALSEADRRVLVYATVLGNEFDFPTLAVAAGGGEEERLAESVDRLVHGGLLREKGGEVYEFVSERVRAEAYAQLTETRRRILHRKVARALEARGRTEPANVFELARQFYLAREDAAALEYNRRAADLASRAYAHATAVVFLERALESLRRQTRADPTTELHLMVELGRVLAENEEFRRSEEVLLQAVERARAEPTMDSELALALLWLARTRWDLGEFASSHSLGEEGFHIMDRIGNRRGLLVAHRVLGVASWRMADLADAERHQRAIIAMTEQDPDGWERGHALIDLANTLVTQGEPRFAEALELYESAARVLSQHDDYTAQARVFMNEALVYYRLPNHGRATEVLNRAIEAAERSHSRIWIGYCRLNEAQFLVEAHHPAEARAAVERARSMLEPLGDQFADQQLTMIEAMILEEEGQHAEAETTYERTLRVARDLHLEAEMAETLFRMARLAFRRGDLDRARERFARSCEAGLYRLKGDLGREADALARELGVPGNPSPPAAVPPPS
jgi:tetratricopeptide (TPR) repeat protein